jgi:carboxyl-terminal processing protease
MPRLRLLLPSLLLLGCSSPNHSTGGKPAAPLAAGQGSGAGRAATASGDPDLPPPAADAPPADPREAKLSGAIVALLEEEHLRKHPLDDTTSRAAFDFFLDRIDGGKMFLLREDVERLSRHADKIDDELHAGRLDLAHEATAIFQARLAVIQKAVAEILSKPLDSSDQEFLELDPKKVERAATEAELKDRWRRRLELEVLDRVALMEERLKARKDPKAAQKEKAAGKKPAPVPPGAPGATVTPAAPPAGAADDIPATPEAREAKARAAMADSYQARFTRLASPDPIEAAADLVNAVTATFDPHTNYLPPSDKANFDIQMSGSLEGIGAVLIESDHYIKINELVPGGASWRQGDLEPGDLILTVAQEGAEPVDVADMRIDEVVKMIRGPRGTQVTLSIQKATGEIKSVTITRDVVVIEEAYARGAILHHKKSKLDYGYIYLPSFYGNRDSSRTASTDLRRLLGELAGKKVAGVIIDLRGNGGGLLGDAVETVGLLIDRGPVVQTQTSAGKREVLGDDKDGTSFDGNVVVMVDRFSASASEIMAGALQDYHRAVIVGTAPTHGKGTVQVLADLDRVTGGKDNLGVLKLTIQQFFRVSGSSTQWKGVVPDVLLPDPAGHLDTGERQLDNSIPWSAIDEVAHQDWPSPWHLDQLVAHSGARVAKNPVLSKIAARSALLRERMKETQVPLEKKAWLAQRDQQRQAIEASSPDLSKGPARMTVTLLPEEHDAAPRPAGKADDRTTRWRDGVARDPWLEEALLVLADMPAAAASTAAK